MLSGRKDAGKRIENIAATEQHHMDDVSTKFRHVDISEMAQQLQETDVQRLRTLPSVQPE